VRGTPLAVIKTTKTGNGGILMLNPQQVVSIYAEVVHLAGSGEKKSVTTIVVSTGGVISTDMTVAQVCSAIRRAEEQVYG
jgi:hypothetical protein